jgi:hypothetical protein
LRTRSASSENDGRQGFSLNVAATWAACLVPAALSNDSTAVQATAQIRFSNATNLSRSVVDSVPHAD